ncbi:MAG: SGNH/GDSL hydrolase family protein [Micrococcales bacterium]|nr:SGNH/GDSL hydrolase family protein [Micrococcales bacterium]
MSPSPRGARRALSVLAVTALVAGLGVAGASAAPDDAPYQPTEAVNVVVVGDSYSSGNGTGLGRVLAPTPVYGYHDDAYRSSLSYAQGYVTWLNTQGAAATLRNLAVSGATTATVMADQLPLVPADTDVVLLTIGGNDAGFSTIIQLCFAPGARDPERCSTAVTAAEAQIPVVIESTRQILTALEQQLRPGAEVVLVGYPRLALGDVDYVLRSDTATYDAGQAIRAVGQVFDDAQRTSLVGAWNAEQALRVTYVPTAEAFAGHEPDPRADVKNDRRWINEFFETLGATGPGGITVAVLSVDQPNWYHPNVAGHQAIAARIATVVGMPAASRPIPTTTDDETTRAGTEPFAWIQGPYAAEVGSTITVDARGSYAIGADLVSFEWDWDGDGTYSEPVSTPLADRTFETVGTWEIGLRVTDSEGREATATTRVRIDPSPLVFECGQACVMVDLPGVRELTPEEVAEWRAANNGTTGPEQPGQPRPGEPGPGQPSDGAPSAPDGNLAKTGADSGTLLLGALGLMLLVFGAAVMASRRRLATRRGQ